MEMSRPVVALREDGDTYVVTDAEWQRSDIESVVEGLSAYRVLQHRNVRGGHILVSSRFVGVMSLPTCRIEITAKFPKAFRQMRAFLRSALHRELLPGEQVGSDYAQYGDLFSHYVDALAQCVDAGLPMQYVKVTARTNRPKGRLNIRGSIKPWSQGATFAAVCDFHELCVDNDFQQLTAAVSTLVRNVGELSPADAAKLDASMECVGVERAVSVHEAKKAAEALVSRHHLTREASLVVDLAKCLLDDQLPVPPLDMKVGVGVARFLRSDLLWEQTVVACLRRCLVDSAVVSHPYASTPTALLDPGGPSIDPDIVVYEGNTPWAICDAKWKGVRSSDAGDVYQILAYAERLKAKHALLVYIDQEDRGWCRWLGRSASDVNVWEVGSQSSEVLASLQTQLASWREHTTG